jgi:serine/threonine protein kinase
VRNGEKDLLNHERIRKIITDLGEGVDFLHDYEFVHGNLKPSNILLDENYRATIGDLCNSVFEQCGCYRERDEKNDRYLSPWLRGRDENGCERMAKKECDVFALGCILYDMLRTQYEAECRSVMCDVHELIRKDTRWIPDKFAELIGKCLAENPDNRPSSFTIWFWF